MKNIFVGNLDFHTTEEELRHAFEPYGQIDKVSIMTERETGRSRGFAFVEMTNADEGDKAITALNGSQIGTRTVNVNKHGRARTVLRAEEAVAVASGPVEVEEADEVGIAAVIEVAAKAVVVDAAETEVAVADGGRYLA